MGFFSGITKFIGGANKITNSVMKVVDPVGGILKEKTETASQKAVTTLLGGLFGAPGTPDSGYDDLGGTAPRATSDEAMQSAKNKKINDAKQRRQGFSGGSTLLTTTDDESQRLNKNTLLGM